MNNSAPLSSYIPNNPSLPPSILHNPEAYSFDDPYESREAIQERIDRIKAAGTPTQQYVRDPNAPLPVERFLEQKRMEAQSGIRPQSEMEGVSTNLGTNLANNARRYGTALTYIGTHLPEFLKDTWDEASKYLQNHSITEVPLDALNAWTKTYNLDLKNLKGKSAWDVIQDVAAGAYANPLDVAIDFFTFGGGKLVSGALRNVPVVGRMAKGAEVERGIAASKAGVSDDIYKLGDKLVEIDKKAVDLGVDTAKVVEAMETGKTVSTAAEKQILKEYKGLFDEWNEMGKKYSPATYTAESAEKTAISQKILRDRIEKGINPNETFINVNREITALLESGEDIAQLAKEGNTLAKEYMGAKALYNKGRINPVTHAKSAIEDAARVTVDASTDAARLGERAGVLGNRILGTSSYEAIAKSLANPEPIIDDLVKNYTEKSIAKSILDGELGGLSLTRPEDLRRVKYLDRGLLEEGRLSEAIKSAQKVPNVNGRDIPLDRDILAEISKQTGNTEGFFGTALKDYINTSKGAMLASGTYLGPNVITGALNALLNSGGGIIQDTINAIKSGGELSKKLGAYRYSNPQFAKGDSVGQIANRLAQKGTYMLGGKMFGKVDRLVQNQLAEIAAHAELRKMGVPSAQRLERISQLDKAKLGQLITDVKSASLQPRTRSVIPSALEPAIMALNPFYKWIDTATMASYDILKKNPLMANLVLSKVLADIAFDKEMQNRLNLNVSLDKPYVSFRMDKNGNMREMTADFIPSLTPIKFFDFGAGERTPASIPFFTAMFNATQGKDRYGRYFKRPETIKEVVRTVGDKRIRYNKATGTYEDVKGGYGDEIFATAIREFIGVPNTFNRTIAPLLAPIFGENSQYYQPYGNKIFGSFSRGTDVPYLFGGNDLNPRTAQDVINALGGNYERTYLKNLEERPDIMPQDMRRFWKGYNMEAIRRYYGGNLGQW